MPRTYRPTLAGTVYHLIARFVANEWFIGDHERSQYLALLGRALGTSDWTCFAYAIMSNHIHLALIAGKERLAEWLRWVHWPFAEWINDRRERIGAVFTRGPRMIGYSDAAAAKLIAYIHRNPVRAGVVERPEQSAWTSQRAYVDESARPRWLAVDEGVRLSGLENAAAVGRFCANDISRTQLDAMRLVPLRRGRPPEDRRFVAAFSA